jgi:hypothetical protein
VVCISGGRVHALPLHAVEGAALVAKPFDGETLLAALSERLRCARSR